MFKHHGERQAGNKHTYEPGSGTVFRSKNKGQKCPPYRAERPRVRLRKLCMKQLTHLRTYSLSTSTTPSPIFSLSRSQSHCVSQLSLNLHFHLVPCHDHFRYTRLFRQCFGDFRKYNCRSMEKLAIIHRTLLGCDANVLKIEHWAEIDCGAEKRVRGSPEPRLAALSP